MKSLFISLTLLVAILNLNGSVFFCFFAIALPPLLILSAVSTKTLPIFMLHHLSLSPLYCIPCHLSVSSFLCPKPFSKTGGSLLLTSPRAFAISELQTTEAPALISQSG
jgi:hypothetical protein